MNKHDVKIDAIIFKHNSEEHEYCLWEEFSLTDEEKETIANILCNHINDGVSFVGTKHHIAEYIKDTTK